MATKNKNTFPKRGAAQPFISQNDCKNLKILVPNESLMKNFSYLINTFNTEINLFQKKNTTLRQTRDLLLPKLISGKIDVSDLDIDTSILND